MIQAREESCLKNKVEPKGGIWPPQAHTCAHTWIMCIYHTQKPGSWWREKIATWVLDDTMPGSALNLFKKKNKERKK